MNNQRSSLKVPKRIYDKHTSLIVDSAVARMGNLLDPHLSQDLRTMIEAELQDMTHYHVGDADTSCRVYTMNVKSQTVNVLDRLSVCYGLTRARILDAALGVWS